jgi:hypothetical protein
MRLVVGSTALALHLPVSRNPKDVDTFSNQPSRSAGEDAFWDDRLLEYWYDSTDRFASLDELYTIKVSHAYWAPIPSVWNKHMFDVVTLKRAGAVLIPSLHAMLYSIWEEQLGKKLLNLNQDSSDFFDDAVKRAYDHESIHYSVAYGDHPLFESYRKNGASVAMDMRKVWAASFEDQVRLFREEVYATALERKVIPAGYEGSPRMAYAWALCRTITSLTKGRSAQFMVENYGVFRDPDMDYVSHHLSKKHKLVRLEA